MAFSKKNIKYFRKHRLLVGSFFVFTFFIFQFINLLLPTVFAAPDLELTYHGKLTDNLGLAVPNGIYNFTLTIHDAQNGGNCVWSARGTCGTPSSKSVTVTNGVFTTALGESGDAPLNVTFGTNYYLEVQIGSNSPMTPRRKITPAGFALNANRLNGLTADNYIDTSGTGQIKAGALTVNGNFSVGSGALQINPSGQVTAGSWRGTAISSTYGGTGINTSSASGVPTLSSGTWSVNSNLSVALGGTGTSTQFTPGSIVFAGASGIYNQDNANFFWDDTNDRFGIGTNAPSATLTVAGKSNSTLVTSGTVTLSNMRMSSISNTAFVDFSSAGALLPYKGNRVVIADGEGDIIEGYIKDAGSGETLSGTNIITSWTNGIPPITDYSIFTSSGSNITRAYEGSAGLAPSAQSNAAAVLPGQLYKLTINMSRTSGVIPFFTITESSHQYYYNLSNGLNTIYYLSSGASVKLMVSNMADTADFSATFDMQKVLTPSATGVTIVNMINGTSYNWLNKDANFGYNNSSGYTYRIYDDAPGNALAMSHPVTGNLLTVKNTGNIGIGTTSPSAKLHTIGTTEQFRVGYDTSNYFSTTVGSTGGVNFDAVGAGAGFTFSDSLTIAGNILPSTNDTYDLGSDTSRFRDLYLGGDTVHIGTSGTDEGLFSYNTTANILNFNTDSTTNGDIAFFTNNLYLDKSTGNIGIGTTSPTFNLDVIGVAGFGGISTSNLIFSGNASSILSAHYGFDGYTNFSGGIGTGSESSNALRITNTGNLTNIGSIQGGEMSLARGGTFVAKVNYSTAPYPHSIATGDVNGDGNIDLAVGASSNVSILLNNGNGTFSSKTDYPSFGAQSGNNIVLSDFNGDGKADLAVANGSYINYISVLINSGNGTFAPKVNYPTGTSPNGVVAVDFNGDGSTDLAVANANANSVSVLFNNGNGTFAPKVDYPTSAVPFSVSTGNLNGDGKADLAVANTSSSSVSVFFNNGNGTFAPKVDYSTGNQPDSVTIGDVDNDGQDDLVVANYGSSTISVLINNGNGTFAPKVDYPANSPRSVAIDDINGDGKNDVVLDEWWNSSLSVLINNGNGTFASLVTYSAGSGAFGIALADFNNDNISDIVVANNYDHTVSVLMNQSKSMLYAQASTGNIGIGTSSPTQLLTVNNGTTTGTYTTTGWVHASDARLKTNIEPIDDPLHKVLQLDNVYFNWKTNPNSDRQIGFIAQDVKNIIPEVVVGNEQDGYGIAYGNITALLAGAIKEQNTQITTNTKNLTTKATATSLADLQKMTDEQFLETSELLRSTRNGDDTLRDDILVLQADANFQADTIGEVQNSLADAQAGLSVLNTLLNFTENDYAHFTDLLSINPEKIVYVDAKQNVTIGGIMVVTRIETNALVITGEEKGATIGEAEIVKDAYDVFVPTNVAVQNSRIFITPKGGVVTQTLSITRIDDNSGFHVTVAEPTEKPIKFDWLIVEDDIERDAESGITTGDAPNDLNPEISQENPL